MKKHIMVLVLAVAVVGVGLLWGAWQDRAEIRRLVLFSLGGIAALPPSPAPTFLQLDIQGAFSIGLISHPCGY